MLETIRQFSEEQLVAHGEASVARAAHAHYFAGREADIMALWDSPTNAWHPRGSPSNWRTCVRRFGGQPTRVTPMLPRPLPPTCRSSR
jgi:hypothetical protein